MNEMSQALGCARQTAKNFWFATRVSHVLTGPICAGLDSSNQKKDAISSKTRCLLLARCEKTTRTANVVKYAERFRADHHKCLIFPFFKFGEISSD